MLLAKNYEPILKYSDEAFAITDKELSLINFSDQFQHIFESYGGANISAGVPILHRDINNHFNLNDEDLQIIRHGKLMAKELVFYLHENKLKYYRLTCKPIMHNGGSFEGVFISLTDQTEMKVAQNSVKLREHRYRALVEHGSDAIVVLDPQGKPSYVSPSIKHVLGYSEEEAMSLNFFELAHADDLGNILTKVQESLANPGKPILGNLVRKKHKDGTYRWLESTLTNLLHEPTINGIVKNFRDISERVHSIERDKKTKKILGSTNRILDDYKRAIDSSSIVAITDLYGIITYANSNFEKTSGYSAEELLGKNHSILKSGHHSSQFFKNMWDTINSGQIWRGDIKNKSKSGDYYWVATTIVPFMDQSGKPKQFISIRFDITDKKNAESKLKSAYEEKSKLLESIQDGFLSLDENWKIAYWNKEAEKLIKKKEEAVLGQVFWEAFPETKRFEFRSEFQRAKAEKVPVRFEEYYEPLSSWFHLSVFPSGEGLTVTFKEITDWKKTELELAKYKKIIEDSTNGIAMADLQGDCFYLNPAFSKKLGHTVESLRASGGPKILFSDEKTAEDVFNTLPSGQHWSGDVDLIDHNGNYVKFHLDGGPIYDEKNSLVAIYGIHTDITQRKKTEKELRVAFEERNAILESIGDAFFAVDEQWNVIYWNHAAEVMFHQSKQKILNKNLWEMYPDAVGTAEYGQYLHAMQTGQITQFEQYYAPIDKWLDISAYPTPHGLLVFLRDVTERKNAMEQIKQSNQRFISIAEATHDAIWDWDIQNDQRYYGDGFRKLFGHNFTTATNLQAFWQSNVHPDDLEAALETLHRCLRDEDEKFYYSEYRFLKANGQYAHVIDRASIIRNSKGAAQRIVGAVQDVTDRKQYEESLKMLNKSLSDHAKELAISNKELEQFAYVASHDLQEPLRMITGFLTQLDKKYGHILDEKAHQYIDFATDGAKRMRQIILDLLEYSRVGRTDAKLENVDLNELVEDVLILNRKLIQETNASIQVGELPTIVTFQSPMIQVMHNLINNALKYKKADVTTNISINATELKNHWQISVADNGIGILDEYHEKIFIIFQRLHQNEEYAGTGMGLAVTKKIVETLGGKIWVESKENEGSTFHFTISKKVGQQAASD